MQPVTLAKLTFESPEATTEFAVALSRILTAGDVLLLSGPIGAGKTHFVRSAIQSMLTTEGRSEDVPSPSFTLVQTFNLQDFEIWHADLYRLGDASEFDELGLSEAFETALCFVEWPENVAIDWPDTALHVAVSLEEHPDQREFVITGDRPHWDDRIREALMSYGGRTHG